MGLFSGQNIFGSAKSFGGPGMHSNKEGALQDVETGYGNAMREMRTYAQPWVNFGLENMDRLRQLMSNPSAIAATPQYQFLLTQGLEGLGKLKGAKGKFFSGETQQDIIDYSQGLASQEYGKEFARLAGLTTMGQQASLGTGQDFASLNASMGRDTGSMKYDWAKQERGMLHQFGMSAWNSMLGGMGGSGGGGGG